MIRLLIKGDKSVADQELGRQGIPFKFVTQYQSVGFQHNTIVLVPRSYEADIINWYCRNLIPPFEDGTLLHYTFQEETGEVS